MKNQNEINTQNLEISKINVANNTRKSFNENDLKELSNSIKNQGVLQPITVRETTKGNFELVFGERRLRASKMANLTHIPTQIKKLTDREVFEIQITENMQRADVHPIEEANAFLEYTTKHKATQQETADFFGISLFKVNKRLKLAELIPKFQEVFKANIFKTPIALELAQLGEEKQNILFEENFTDWNENEFRKPNLSYLINQLNADLKNATWDLTEDNIAGCGACNVCPFNKGITQLFGEDTSCSNKPCFDKKNKVSVEKLILDAHKNGVAIVKDYWSNDTLGITICDDNKIKMLDNYRGVDLEEKPTLETYEEFVKSNWDDDLEEKELREKYKEEVEQYNEALKEFEDNIANGTFQKVFYLKDLEYSYAILDKKEILENSQKGIKQELSIEDTIELQKYKIVEREKRMKELDNEKISNVLYEEKTEDYLNLTDELTPKEFKAFLFSVALSLNWNMDDLRHMFTTQNYDKKNVSKKTQNKLFRALIVSQLKQSVANKEKTLTTKAFHLCLNDKFPTEYKNIEDAQMEIRKTREEKVNAKLENLK